MHPLAPARAAKVKEHAVNQLDLYLYELLWSLLSDPQNLVEPDGTPPGASVVTRLMTV